MLCLLKLLKSVGSVAFLITILFTSCTKNALPFVKSTLTEGLEGYWKLDELSGNAMYTKGRNIGITYLVTQGIPGKIGTCYKFTRDQRSYVDYGNIALSTYSLSFWAKRASTNAGECIIGFGRKHEGLWIFSDNRLTLADNEAVALGKWCLWTDKLSEHHIVLIAAAGEPSGNVELFIDGISQGSRSYNIPEISNLVLGSDYVNGAYNSRFSFEGTIDEVGLWNRPLSPSEVKELYAKGAGKTFPFDEEEEIPGLFFYSHPYGRLLHSCDNKMIILEKDNSVNYIKYSDDNGLSYKPAIEVSSNRINKARILANGNIVLFGLNRIYSSNDNLSTIQDCIILDKDGSNYEFHEPVNPDFPGGYFEFMGGFAESDGISVLGTYTNSAGGASPVILWYSLDGFTWKEFYTFGQNLQYSDNGTTGGGPGGTLLGDPNNPLTARHIHAVNVGHDGNFYACTGDANRSMHFLKCSYDRVNDKWQVDDLLTYTSSNWQRMRALGVYERDGFLYWGSDGPGILTFGGNTYDCYGIYKCAASDISDPTKHILLQPLTDACYSFLNFEQYVFAGLYKEQGVLLSKDYGETWTSYPTPEWMSTGIQGVWYNDLHNYFGTSTGTMIYSYLSSAVE